MGPWVFFMASQALHRGARAVYGFKVGPKSGGRFANAGQRKPGAQHGGCGRYAVGPCRKRVGNGLRLTKAGGQQPGVKPAAVNKIGNFVQHCL